MTPVSFRVLIAADDDTLRVALLNSLNTAGFNPHSVSNVRETMEAVRSQSYDLVLLSVGGVFADTLEVCTRLRVLSPDLGIVMVRRRLTDKEEALALDAGADDYIAVPYRFRELIARLGVVLHRSRAAASPAGGLIKAGDIEIDPDRRLLFIRGKEVHLSPREFDLLFFLMKNPDEVLTNAKAIRAVWGPEAGPNPQYLRSYIKALRHKIEQVPTHPRYILTVPWVGYRFRNPDNPYLSDN